MADFTTKIVTRFEIEAEAQNQALSEVSSRMEKVGRQLEKSTDGFDKLRSAVDATGDRLRIFGQRGKRIADAIEDNIRDPVERARLSMKHLQIEATRVQGPFDTLGQKLGRFKVDMVTADQELSEFGLSFRNIGIAIAAAGVALTAFTVKSVKRFIDSSFEAQASAGRLAAAFDQFQVSVGELTFNQLGMDSYFDSLSANLRSTASEISAINRALTLGETKKAFRILFGIDKVKPVTVGGADEATEVEYFVEIEGVPGRRQFFPKAQEREEARERAAQKELDKFDRERKAEERKADAAKRRARARAKAARAQRGRSAESAAEGLFQRGVGAAGAAAGDVPVGGRAAAQSVFGTVVAAQDIAGMADDLEKIAGDAGPIAGIARGMDALKKSTDSYLQSLEAVGDIGKSSFAQLFSSIGQSIGAMSAGTATLGDFGKSMLQTLGAIATQWGTFFITAGSGFAFLPGGQGASPGMIAAGIGLTALGAGLQAVSSGSTGRTAGGGGGASGAADFARDLFRRDDDEPKETTIQVFVAGDQIRDPIWKVVDEGVRLGRMRHLQPQG